MCDKCKNDHSNGFSTGVVLGAVLGAFAGYFFSTEKGKEVLKELKTTAANIP